MRHPRNNGSGDGCFLYRENRRAHVTRIGSVGGRNQECVRPSKSSRRLRHGSIRIRMVRRCAGRVSSYRLTSLPPDRCTRLRPRCSGLSASSLRTVFPSNCRGGGMFLAVEVFSGDVGAGMVVAEQIGGFEIVCLVAPLPPDNLRFVRNPAPLSIARRYR